MSAGLAGPAPYGAIAGAPAPVPGEPEAPKGETLATLKRWFRAYEDAKQAEMIEARDARRYYHGQQWTDEEERRHAEQNRPVITINRLALKIDGIVGVVERLRMDPKATARTEAFAAGATIGTAAVREVFDANRWDDLSREVAADLARDGIGGCERDAEPDLDGQLNVVLRRVAPETFFYDPRSMRPDFSDARYMGVYKWVDLDAALEMVPEQEASLRAATDRSGGSTPAQQDWEKNWYDTRLERVKLVECWYRHRGEWWFALHTGDMVLKEGRSPWLDRRGRTRCRYNMASSGIDHDGTRYGFVRNMRSPQDEINHRRSWILHTLHVNQIFYEDGAVDDPNALQRDLLKRDAAIRFRRTASGQKPWEFRDFSQQVQGQAELLAEAKAEIDNFGPNAALLGSGPGSASGRAQALQQQAGIAQLGPYFGRYKGWKLGLYRDVWLDVQQLWTAPRAIRVAGPGEFDFINVNQMVMTPEGPRIANAIGELDLDIVLDEGPDGVTLREDDMMILDSLIQKGMLAGPGALPAVAEVANWSPALKQKILQAAAGPQPTPEQMQEQQAVKALQIRDAAARVAKTEAETARAQADAVYRTEQARDLASDDVEMPVREAAEIADIAHKHARTRQIGVQTAEAAARLGVLGAASAPAPRRPRDFVPDLDLSADYSVNHGSWIQAHPGAE